jgi:cation-transporting ATPase E
VKTALDEIGWIKNENDFITGEELNKLSGADYRNAISGKTVFSRLSPEDKLNIVKELKHNKIETAVIGDGVNDLPAIKESALGIAMEEGSAITRDAADIVLLKNKFTILPEIFEEGNRIINSVLYVSKMLITKNSVILVLAVLSWFMLYSFPLTPRSSSLINLLAVGLPSYFIALNNKNTAAVTNFFSRLFKFVFVSAGAIIFISLVSGYTGSKILKYNSAELNNFITVILVTTLILNYLCAVYDVKKPAINLYIISASVLIIAYIFLVIAGNNIPVINIITSFYEISPISLNMWLYILMIVIPGGLLLMSLSYLYRGKPTYPA